MARARCRNLSQSHRAGPMAEYTVKRFNKIKRAFGLPDIKVIDRKCLRCDKKFKSVGIENRLCEICNKYSPGHHDLGAKVHGCIN